MKSIMLKAASLLFILMFSTYLYGTDFKSKGKLQSPDKNNIIINKLIEAVKKDGYVLLNLQRDSYTFVIPTSNKFSNILKKLEDNNVITSDQMKDFYLLWNKVHKNGGVGILEHEPINKQKQSLLRDKLNLPESALNSTQPEDNNIYNYLGAKAELLKGVVDSHHKIKKAQTELEYLKKERNNIQKHLAELKQKLEKRKKNSALSVK